MISFGGFFVNVAEVLRKLADEAEAENRPASLSTRVQKYGYEAAMNPPGIAEFHEYLSQKKNPPKEEDDWKLVCRRCGKDVDYYKNQVVGTSVKLVVVPEGTKGAVLAHTDGTRYCEKKKES